MLKVTRNDVVFLRIFPAKFDVDGFFANVRWSLFHRATDWLLAQVSFVFCRKRTFAIPKDQCDMATQLQVWHRSRGSGARGSVKSTKMYVSYVTISTDFRKCWRSTMQIWV